MKKKILALVLAAVLVFSTMPSFALSIDPKVEATAANPLTVSSGLDGFKYVSLGDSIAYGYGLEGFYDGAVENPQMIPQPPLYTNTGSYPDQIQKYLRCSSKNYVQGSMCGVRAVDVCTILGVEGYPGDSIYGESIKSQFENLDSDYLNTVQSAVEEADFITVTAGGNDIFTNVMMYLLSDEEIPEFSLENYYSKSAMTAFSAMKTTLINQAKLIDKSKNVAENSEDSAEAKVNKVFDSLEFILYAVGGYVHAEGDLLDRIHEMNPNAVVAITGLPGMYLDFDVQVGSLIIDVEKILGPMYTAVNNVIKNAAEERGTYCRYIDILDMKYFDIEDDYVSNGIVQFDHLMDFLMQNTMQIAHPSKEGCKQIAEKIVSNFNFKTFGGKLTTVKNFLTNLCPAIISRLGVTKVQNFLDIFRQINLWGVVKLSIWK